MAEKKKKAKRTVVRSGTRFHPNPEDRKKGTSIRKKSSVTVTSPSGKKRKVEKTTIRRLVGRPFANTMQDTTTTRADGVVTKKPKKSIKFISEPDVKESIKTAFPKKKKIRKLKKELDKAFKMTGKKKK